MSSKRINEFSKKLKALSKNLNWLGKRIYDWQACNRKRGTA